MKCDELKKQKYCQKLAFGDEVYLAKQVDVAIAELKQKLENVQASMYADVVDANMENRRLKRALYKACANWAMNARMVEIEAEPWGRKSRKSSLGWRI